MKCIQGWPTGTGLPLDVVESVPFTCEQDSFWSFCYMAEWASMLTIQEGPLHGAPSRGKADTSRSKRIKAWLCFAHRPGLVVDITCFKKVGLNPSSVSFGSGGQTMNPQRIEVRNDCLQTRNQVRLKKGASAMEWIHSWACVIAAYCWQSNLGTSAALHYQELSGMHGM